MRKASIEEWDVHKEAHRNMRRAKYAVAPDSESSSDESDRAEDHQQVITRRYRKKRDDSDEEDDIPLVELQKQLQASNGVKSAQGKGGRLIKTQKSPWVRVQPQKCKINEK